MNDGVILAMLAMAPCFNSVSARFSSSPTLAVHPILDDPGLAPAKRQGWHHHSRRNFEQGLSRDHGQIVADRYERWLPAYPKRIEIRPRFIQESVNSARLVTPHLFQLAPNLGNWTRSVAAADLSFSRSIQRSALHPWPFRARVKKSAVGSCFSKLVPESQLVPIL
ncbi:hypothetical protein A9K55_000245, partial [Cordyceps militaris]